MTRTAWVLVIALLTFAAAVSAQDPGIPDSVELIPTITPDAQTNQLHLRLELWVFNDEELAAANMGFSWDNPNLQLDSAVAPPLTNNGFTIGPFFYEDNSLATTNANQRCLFGGVAIIPLFPGDASGRRHWATYYFTLSSWDEADVINIDTLRFNDASEFQFVLGTQTPFIPNWLGGFTIVDPNAPQDLLLSSDSLHFNSVQGGPAPAFQEFTITASTGGAIPFTLSEDAPWLLVSPITGSTPRDIRAEINNISVTAGSYIDTIEVNSIQAANTPLYVVVTLDVAPPPPTISVSPTAFFFNAIANDTNPDPKTLIIKNIGGTTLNWTATNNELWLDVNPGAGVDSVSVDVSVDITGLTLGTYYDTIVVSDPSASNNPRSVPVTLSIASDLPIIEVDSLFNFVVVQTGVAAFDSSYITVRNGGGGTMDFWLETTSPRLQMFPDSGTAPETIKTKIRLAAGLQGNDYNDTIWVYSNQAINSPVPVVMFLHYVANPAVLQVVPSLLSYNLFECAQGISGLPPILNFNVQNSGADNPMNVNIVYESDLFTVLPTSGTAPKLFTVITNFVQLPLGSYKDTIWVYAQSAENSLYPLEVTLNVIPGSQTPQIHLMDSMFTFSAQEDHGPILEKYFRIQNRWGGCMEWHIDNSIPWANIYDTAGNVPDTIGIYPTAFGLTFGQYTDSFTISAPSASNTPRQFRILFKVWRLHGDVNYDNQLNILDLTNVVDYMFRSSGILPQPELYVGDCNCDEKYNIQDLTYLVDYFFRFGPTPCGNPVKKSVE